MVVYGLYNVSLVLLPISPRSIYYITKHHRSTQVCGNVTPVINLTLIDCHRILTNYILCRTELLFFFFSFIFLSCIPSISMMEDCAILLFLLNLNNLNFNTLFFR